MKNKSLLIFKYFNIMNNKNELNNILVRLINGTPKDEKYYARLNGVKSYHELRQVFDSIDQEVAVACRKMVQQNDNIKTTKSTDPEIWLKTADVINHYPISRRTLATYRKEKKLPYSRLGRDCIYQKSEVDALMFRNYNGKKV